jgi:hypothetical protein
MLAVGRADVLGSGLGWPLVIEGQIVECLYYRLILF